MSGMNRTTGRAITGPAHLRQSVVDILTTPIGSRVMRRTYGSLIPALIDQPLNPALSARISAAAVSALSRWEPRLLITRVQLTPHTDHDTNAIQQGRGNLLIQGSVRELATSAQPIELTVQL